MHALSMAKSVSDKVWKTFPDVGLPASSQFLKARLYWAVAIVHARVFFLVLTGAVVDKGLGGNIARISGGTMARKSSLTDI